MRYNQIKKILIVEDDRSLSLVIMRHLESMGYEVSIALDGESGLAKATSENYSLILCDIALPKMSGFKIIEKLKYLESKIPIIIITSFDTNENEIDSYRYGANIFHKKPINFNLLKVQIKMLIDQYKPSLLVKIGDLQIDPDARMFYKDKSKITLSKKEFELLHRFFISPGQVMSRREIIGYLHLGSFDAADGSVDTLVSRLRKKLGKYKEADIIETVYGEGYRLNIELLHSY